VTSLLLKRASASRSSGEWSESDYDVLADGVVIGGIMRAAAAPRGRCRGPFTRPASSWRMPLSRPRARSRGSACGPHDIAPIRILCRCRPLAHAVPLLYT
jgi:hypothetical protein